MFIHFYTIVGTFRIQLIFIRLHVFSVRKNVAIQIRVDNFNLLVGISEYILIETYSKRSNLTTQDNLFLKEFLS